MTADQFAARLGAWGESIPNMQPTLTGIAEDVKQKIKIDYGRGGLKRRTNSLYNSIDVRATDSDTISISMNDYGLYNNYGVAPAQTIKPTEFGLPGFSGKWGLPARNFFRESELTAMIAQDIAIEITEQL